VASPWSSELGKFLDTLKATLAELIEAMGEKSVALRDLNEPLVVEIVSREERLAARLKALLNVREQVLGKARERGWNVDSLAALVQRLPIEDREPLLSRLDAIRDLTLKLRHTSWAHWVLAHRCSQQAQDLFDLIAHGGHQPATYESPLGGPGPAAQPAILDAAA
jgi:hypothetical protein